MTHLQLLLQLLHLVATALLLLQLPAQVDAFALRRVSVQAQSEYPGANRFMNDCRSLFFAVILDTSKHSCMSSLGKVCCSTGPKDQARL